jgi:hypothetical protein
VTVVVYTPQLTPRQVYIFNVLFDRLLDTPAELTSDMGYWEAHEGPKLIYSQEDNTSAPWMWAHTLLFEENITEQDRKVKSSEGIPYFFESPKNVKSLMPYDPFAAAFYMISRYEEYHTAKRDKHGRYLAENSIAYQGGFLNRPIVHHWALGLKNALQRRYPELQCSLPPFQLQPTFDIDNAYAYKHKGVARTTAALLRSLLTLNGEELRARLATLAGKKDPYDSFEAIQIIHTKLGLRPVFFWLVGNYGPYDKNISIKNDALRKCIRSAATWSTTGIHPSYGSHERKSLKEEKLQLEKVVGETIVHNRFHYLRFSLSSDYQNLIDAGIQHDHSMGYAETTGFRAGMAVPFPFYDLKQECTTALEIHPFCAMDATLFYHLQFTATEAKTKMLELMEEVKGVGGNFTLIYHNESFGDKPMWKGWRKAYVEMMQMGQE